MEKEHIEYWLAVNDQGRGATSFDGPEEAIRALMDEHGGAAARTVHMSVLMELPTSVEAAPIEILNEDGDDTTIEIEEEDEDVEHPAEGDKDSPVKEPGPEGWATVTA